LVTSCDAAFTISNDNDLNTLFIDIKTPSPRSRTLIISLSVTVILISVLLAVVLFSINRNRHKVAVDDLLWSINANDLHFSNPPQVIGRGTFGVVLLVEYRGTLCAVKRANPSTDIVSSDWPIDSDETEFYTFAEPSKIIDDRCWDENDLERAVDHCQQNKRANSTTSLREPIEQSLEFKIETPIETLQVPREQCPKIEQGNLIRPNEQNQALRRMSSFNFLPRPNEQSQDLRRQNSTNTLQVTRKSMWSERTFNKAKDNFVNEMKILASLRHPRIVTIMGKYTRNL
jgi:serine/threonine protein kinase